MKKIFVEKTTLLVELEAGEKSAYKQWCAENGEQMAPYLRKKIRATLRKAGKLKKTEKTPF